MMENDKIKNNNHYLFMIGNLYINRIQIDDCDNEINIGFTSNIDYAKEFSDLDYLTFKDLVELLLNCKTNINFIITIINLYSTNI